MNQLTGFLLVVSIGVLCVTSSFCAMPNTIPSLKTWTNGSGTCSINSSSRIVYAAASNAVIGPIVQTLRNDIYRINSLNLQGSTAASAPGDIVLILNSTGSFHGPEGYSQEIVDHVTITAFSDTGLFRGTRTLLQLLWQSSSLPRGTALDWPDYPERGIMVDLGRKYFTIQWLKNHIVELSYIKMNLLHLHLSDDLGIRVESAVHPEVVSPEHYTKTEIGELVGLARRYYINLIPELDVPGHVGWLKASHSDLLLNNNGGVTNFLDITKPGAYSLIADLLNEYIPLFPGKCWHIGADEYVGAANYSLYPQLEAYAKTRYGSSAGRYDGYLGFIAFVDSIARSKGKQTRTWADAYEYLVIASSAVGLSKNIVQEVWNAYEDPNEITSAGYTIQNSSFHPTYYNLGAYQGELDVLYEQWAPYSYFGGWPGGYVTYPTTLVSNRDKLTGAKLSIWCDTPAAETEDQVASGIFYRLRAMAQNCWGSPRLTPALSGFQPIADQLGNAPGYGGPYDDIGVTAVLNHPVAKTARKLQAYSNPLNRSTTISFEVNATNSVELSIYNPAGMKIATFAERDARPGGRTIQWNAGNLPAGLYVARLLVKGRTESCPLMVIR
jgi:hexosaminidase